MPDKLKHITMENMNPIIATQRVRLSQRDIFPTAIKPRHFGEIIISTSTQSASATLGNNDQALVTITTSQPNGAKIFCVPDMSLYIGSVDDANQLPGGSTIDESQWQVIGPWNDWGATDNKNVKTKIYVRNISAGAGQSLLVRVIQRYIVNILDTATA